MPRSAGFSAADLTNALERNKRLTARVQQLENRLSSTSSAMPSGPKSLYGLGAPSDIDQLHRRISLLEQEVAAKQGELDERTEEPEAARAANRELTRALNHRL
ncbi:hypothetical protein ACWFRM_01195 [Streptomyces sp. NPDC055144]